MSDIKDTIEYRKKQAINLIEQYKDLMGKYDLVFDIDGLEGELNKAKTEDEKTDIEKKLLIKLDNRKKGLEKKEEILDKIFNLEKYLIEKDENGDDDEGSSSSHPSKRYRRN